MTNGNDETTSGGKQPRDLTKKLLTLGLGAYFLTEDTVRKYVKEAKIPRDLGKSIVNNATKGKDELYGFVAQELSKFLRQMDVQAEIDRFVQSHTIRINAEIEFVPTEPGAAKANSDEESEEDEAAEGEESSERKSPDVEWNVSFKTKDARPSDEQPQPTEDELLADD